MPVRPTALHPLPEDTLVLQDTRSSTESRTATPGAAHVLSEANDHRRHLPQRAADEDAQAARDKLDRIAKAQQTKRNWAKSTGVTLMFKAFGRNDRRQRKRRHGLSSDEESSDESSQDGGAEGKRNKEEVKLMITGNPVVTKVFDAASRTRSRFRGQIESPDASPQIEEAPFRFSISRAGGSLARRFRPPSATPPPPEAGRKSTNLSPTAEVPPRLSSDNSAAGFDRARSKFRPNNAPELLAVDEEGHGHQDAKDPVQTSAGRLALPFVRSLNNHTPNSLASSSSVNTPGQEVELYKQASHHRSSITGGLIHDEPEAHDYGPAERGTSPAYVSSASDVSSDDELDGSALLSDSDEEEGDNMLKLNLLSLEHGEALTKEQLKRRKKLVGREIQRRKANGEPVDDLIHLHGKLGQLGHKVSSRVSKGIHYGSSNSRNRRAMDRYSPHPGQLALQTSDLPRSTSAQSAGGLTPFSTITPSISRGSNHFGQRRESVATAASSRRSSMTVEDDEDEGDLEEGDRASLSRKTSMIDRSMLSSRNSIRKYFHAPNVIKRRRRKKWEAELAALERAADEEARKADPDAELDAMLAKYAQQQAPSDANKVKHEFDVLYENQRGLLVFGIPKFSPRTLFQWDPSPWTFASGKKSAYNIANAQLPDPSWEWAYSEWLIDMTGDVDEAGWQYSGNFGRRFWPNIHFPHGRIGLPKTGADGIREMNARLAEKEKKRQAKEDTKEDGGFEAIKRSARARSSKWTGTSDAFTFVRRRRWIRLRRRKPLASAAKTGEAAATPAAAPSPAHELDVPDAAGKTALFSGQNSVKPGQSDDERDTESSFGGSDESDSDSSEDDSMLYAPAYGRPSGFLPRRLPGHMANGAHPIRNKDPIARRRARKQMREFTGSIRELKSLLPSIIAMDREAKMSRTPTGLCASQNSYKWAMLKINKVDARNPFINWHFVKHRLQDEDMAFAATTLRSMERKFQQRQLAAIRKRGDTAPKSVGHSSHPPIPSTFVAQSKSIRFDGLAPTADNAELCTLPGTAENRGAVTTSASSSRLLEPFASSPPEGHELSREALIEINFARVLRVLRACKVDRQRMSLWKLWLGVVSLDTLMETARREDLAELGLLAAGTECAADTALPAGASLPAGDTPHMSGGSSFRYRQRAERIRARWRASVPTPDASDVWDVLERKLDDVLLLFEFQSNRAQFIRLLLAVHEKLHPDHIYRDHSLRANPLELSPTHVHGDAAEMGGGGAGGAFGSRLGGWKRAGLPRLEFYSDLQRILAATPGNDASTNSEYILGQAMQVDGIEPVAMPLGHHSSNALIDKLEAEALSDSFLDHEKIASGSVRDDDEGAGANGKQRDGTVGDRLGVAMDTRTSRSPSPISRAPSVPLPYRHSPLTPAVPLSQGSLSTYNRSSADITKRTRGSADSTPPSSAPGATGEDDEPKRGLLKKDGESKKVQGASALKEGSNEASKGETLNAPVVARGEEEEAAVTPTVEALKQTRAQPRPPIPVRSGSVSPQKGVRDRF
ncbi:hypothetical protein EX895_006204 [Sporisorium graminicola]|uniref:Peroxin/Ferlin domain-containing protein n=1 Tax=Sporisorium graminicola TaxID=280036 RepID=A0A4U7KLY2_9BASI|nr:hypothetical protein EX895_006204 [Sporisorium graminicola]TKY85124.1 hypothetical protein EX895_006204 [Sporisorium graminicola]